MTPTHYICSAGRVCGRERGDLLAYPHSYEHVIGWGPREDQRGAEKGECEGLGGNTRDDKASGEYEDIKENAKEYRGIAGNVRENVGIRGNAEEHVDMQDNPEIYRGIRGNTGNAGGTPGNTRECGVIRGIPGNT